MKNEIIEQKINELCYRLRLDDIAINSVAYNLKHAKRLGLTDAKIDALQDKLGLYKSKKASDSTTLEVLKECLENPYKSSNSDNSYYFKCTLPYEKVDPNASYQTSILVGEDVARLFSNGVSYKDILDCLENKDIIDIKSDFSSKIPVDCKGVTEVGVEVVDNNSTITRLDEPILASIYGKPNKGIIASSKISTCYPFGVANYKDLDGENYTPATPSLEDISALKKFTSRKQNEYNNMVNLEETVREKMQISIDKVNGALERAGADFRI